MNTESPTTAKPKRERTPEQKAKAAEAARAKRVAKKAEAEFAKNTGITMATKPVTPSPWQIVNVEGTEVKVSKNLSPEHAEQKARELLAARKPKAVERPAAVAKPKDATAKPKAAAKRGKLDTRTRRDGTIRIYPRQRHIDALSGAAEWKTANPKVWKQIRGAKRIDQKSGPSYYSILLASAEELAAVTAVLDAS